MGRKKYDIVEELRKHRDYYPEFAKKVESKILAEFDRMAAEIEELRNHPEVKREKLLMDLIPDEPTKSWMTAEEGLEILEHPKNVWGYNDEGVQKWVLSFTKECYFLDNEHKTPGTWDKANQPTHVMERIEGEQPPEPPVLTEYEQVKAICEMSAKETQNSGNKWSLRQYNIWTNHRKLWKKAHVKAKKVHVDDASNYYHKILCKKALKLADRGERNDESNFKWIPVSKPPNNARRMILLDMHSTAQLGVGPIIAIGWYFAQAITEKWVTIPCFNPTHYMDCIQELPEYEVNDET